MRTTCIVSSCFWCEGDLSLPVQVFEDPVMAVLFEDKSEPHAWRLAAFFVRHFGGEDEYSPGMLMCLLHTYVAWRSRRGIATVRGYGFHPLFVHHNKGKRCRLRGEDAGTHFTITHRDRWLQYMDDACTDVGVSAGFRARVMGLARSAMGFYGVCFESPRGHVATVLPWCVLCMQARSGTTASKLRSWNGNSGSRSETPPARPGVRSPMQCVVARDPRVVWTSQRLRRLSVSEQRKPPMSPPLLLRLPASPQGSRTNLLPFLKLA